MYDGEWKQDSKDGTGTFKWKSGHKFEGTWEKNEPKNGVLVTPEGTQKQIGTGLEESKQND